MRAADTSLKKHISVSSGAQAEAFISNQPEATEDADMLSSTLELQQLA